MRLCGLLSLLRELPCYRLLEAELRREDRASVGVDITEAARPFLAAALQEERFTPLLVVLCGPEEAARFHESLQAWSSDPGRVMLFPAPDPMFYEDIPWDPETVSRRIGVLSELANGERGEGRMVVTSARALMQRTLPPDVLRDNTRVLRKGQRVDLWELMEFLDGVGYRASPQVEDLGSFSRRGGIVDVFSPCHRLPVRVELFGDEIDSVRFFDPVTQKSRERADQVVIAPTSEAFQLSRGDEAALPPQLLRDRERARRGEMKPPPLEFYLPWLYPGGCGLWEYFPRRGLVFLEPRRLEDEVSALEVQALELRQGVVSQGRMDRDAPIPYLTWDDLAEEFRDRHQVRFDDGVLEEDIVRFSQLVASPTYGGQLKRVLDDASGWKAEGDRIVMITRQADRLSDLWRDRDVHVRPVEDILEPSPPGSLILVRGVLPQGWRMPGLSILTDGDMFGWTRARRRPRVRRRETPSADALFAELKLGDYVVHVEHGIALFRGLVKRTVEGLEREYLLLEYATNDQLYVPTSQADRVSRYVGGRGGSPTLHRLGAADWERAKAQALRAVEDLADELLELYAARQVVPGHAFSSDTPWQREMEDSFPYMETEDQVATIEAVKSDMERSIPMDRLICGDVGYGKTEVALRAAFKAVMDGKQVAVLVPTTVLAQQHVETFSSRLAPYPMKVEMLSRFRVRSEQAEVLEGLREGRVDIVIGTHRLLQKDVAFKDLGLLIIDEEQRFGVTHKERLKQMRKEVDVLTLTATPIPRTLHLALMGAHDMSTIDTPPEERLPIRTAVLPYDEEAIRRAVLREMERGGQVYFVHNRVRGIEQMTRRLSRIVPEARLAIGHGQMPELQLAEVMRDFVSQRVDVLVCTSIIESGLDIPNANTIIINRADRFGLAQLYQLRGRVGRGANRAYAYLMYSPSGGLSDVARRRLQAIFEADELGSGFRVAMHDMEIRGVGDILGSRQHGQISAIGFDLYCRLLARAIQERQEGKKVGAPEEVAPSLPAVELPLEAHLPETYVPDGPARLKLYRRMAQQDTVEGVANIAEEIRDRFGEFPSPVENLLYVLHLRALAARGGLRSISLEGQRVVVRSNGRARAAWHLLPRELVYVGREKVHLSVDPRTPEGRRELLQLLEKAVLSYGGPKRSP